MPNAIDASDQPRLPWTVADEKQAPTNNSSAALFKRPPKRPKRAAALEQPGIASSQSPAPPAVQLDAFEEPLPARTSGVVIDYTVIASDRPGIVLIDPFAVQPEPFNGRGLAIFDPDRNRELIDDIRTRGNTVPVRVRPRPDGSGWTCPSGSRRVNAARVIAAEQSGFRVRAIIDESMTNADAYALCLADNHGRTGVTPLQRGREIKWAIEHLHGGSRQAYIEHQGVDPSVVSRALDLVTLPEPILAHAADREELPTVFAEKLSPRLKDKIERKIVMARAKALGDERLPAPRLLRYLLTGERTAPAADRREIRLGSGRNKLRARVILAPDGSSTLTLPALSSLTAEEKGQLVSFVREQLDELLRPSAA